MGPTPIVGKHPEFGQFEVAEDNGASLTGILVFKRASRMTRIVRF
jgi:hypothetical protein